MLRRHWAHAKASAPTLEQKHRKYYLRFTYEEQVALTQEPAERQRICAVDPGINTDAVCSIMTGDECDRGTVLCVHLPQNKTGCITFSSVIQPAFALL